MTKSYHVFTYSPLDISRHNATSSTSWITASSRTANPILATDTPYKYDHRASLVYHNVIFGDENDENDENESTDWVKAEEWNEPPTQWQSTVAGPAPARPEKSVDNVGLDETYNSFFTADETSMQSEGSSISRFPTFAFNINSISSLSSLSHSCKSGIELTKIIVLLGILEVDGPNYVLVKHGGLAGSEVCILKFIVGDEHGSICQLIAWRETAESWGGIGEEPGLKRGDIVLLQNIRVSEVSARTDGQQQNLAKIQLVASPNLKSSAQICYRTFLYANDDKKWRPDLRLCDSVPAVRKVQVVAKWMERMTGNPPR